MFLFLAQNAFSQYGGGYGGGGYGGGGYGGRGYGGLGRMNGGFNQPTAPSKVTPKDVAKQETKWMKKNLNLTADQEPIIEEINLDYAEQRDNLVSEGLKGDEHPSQEKITALRAKVEELQKRQDDEFKRLLKPEQWETYAQKRQEIKDKNEKEKEKQKMHRN